MKKYYYIGVYLSERVPFGLYGFTNYVDGFTEANTPEEARATAKNYFETKFKTEVTGVRTTITNIQFIDSEKIIKPFKTAHQQNLFELPNLIENEQTRIFPKTDRRIKRQDTLANFCNRSTLYLNRLFAKWKGFNSPTIQ